MLLSIPNASGIYKITCLPTGKFYIGSAVKLNGRRLAHLSLLRRQEHANRHLQSAWDKYGEAAFQFEVIEYVLIPFLIEREQYWLDELKPYDPRRGFNLSPTAGSPLGTKHTPEVVERRAAALRGRKHPPFTPEVLQRMSDAHKGKQQSPETIRKRADARRGHVVSEETRRKISEANKGRSNSEKNRRISSERMKQMPTRSLWWIVTDPNGVEYRVLSLKKFCEERGLRYQNMWNVAAGRRRICQGWTCRRADDD